jgi:hypothetical protein
MGFSPSAELFFGFTLPAYNEETDEPYPWFRDDEGFLDIGEIMLTERGVKNPYLLAPYQILNGPASEFDEWAKEHVPDMEEQVERGLERKKEAARESLVELIHFGHHSDPEPTLGVHLKCAPKFRGDAWEPGVVELYPPDADEINLALGFVQALGMGTQTPKWLLVASYG